MSFLAWSKSPCAVALSIGVLCANRGLDPNAVAAAKRAATRGPLFAIVIDARFVGGRGWGRLARRIGAWRSNGARGGRDFRERRWVSGGDLRGARLRGRSRFRAPAGRLGCH